MNAPLFVVVLTLFGSALLFGAGSGLACDPARPGWTAARSLGFAMMCAGVALFLAVVLAVS